MHQQRMHQRKRFFRPFIYLFIFVVQKKIPFLPNMLQFEHAGSKEKQNAIRSTCFFNCSTQRIDSNRIVATFFFSLCSLVHVRYICIFASFICKPRAPFLHS